MVSSHTPILLDQPCLVAPKAGIHRWALRIVVTSHQPWQQDVDAQQFRRQHGLGGDAALCPRGDSHLLVRREMGFGPLLRDGFQRGPELRQPGQREIELLLQGGGQEIAFGSGGQ